MAFYEMMCHELYDAAFLPNGNKGGFPLLEMATEFTKKSCLYVGKENGEIAAAYIMNNECGPAYEAVPWKVEADKEHASVLHACALRRNTAAEDMPADSSSTQQKPQKTGRRRIFRMLLKIFSEIPSGICLKRK